MLRLLAVWVAVTSVLALDDECEVGSDCALKLVQRQASKMKEYQSSIWGYGYETSIEGISRSECPSDATYLPEESKCVVPGTWRESGAESRGECHGGIFVPSRKLCYRRETFQDPPR